MNYCNLFPKIVRALCVFGLCLLTSCFNSQIPIVEDLSTFEVQECENYRVFRSFPPQLSAIHEVQLETSLQKAQFNQVLISKDSKFRMTWYGLEFVKPLLFVTSDGEAGQVCFLDQRFCQPLDETEHLFRHLFSGVGRPSDVIGYLTGELIQPLEIPPMQCKQSRFGQELLLQTFFPPMKKELSLEALFSACEKGDWRLQRVFAYEKGTRVFEWYFNYGEPGVSGCVSPALCKGSLTEGEIPSSSCLVLVEDGIQIKFKLNTLEYPEAPLGDQLFSTEVPVGFRGH